MILVAVLLSITACAPLPLQEDEAPRDPADSPRLIAAEIALANDDHSAAVTLLRMAAAEFRDPRQADLLLEAALIASELDEPFPITPNSGTAVARLIEAKTLVATAPEQAHRQLLALLNHRGSPLPDRLASRHRQYLAEAERARGRVDQALRWQWEAFDLARSPQQRLRAEAQLWQDLQIIPLDHLAKEQTPPWPESVAPWRALALAVRPEILTPDGVTLGIARWQQQQSYAPHVSTLLVTRIQAVHRHAHAPRQQIALLLPQTGDLARTSQRIKNGFLAAAYAMPEAQRPKRIRLIDIGTEGVSPASGYRDAVTGGAGIIVGPLSKGAIEELIRGAEISTPLIALNRIDSPNPPVALHQFGLAPEDEAAATAATALALGYERVIVLAGNDDWSARVADAFTSTLIEGGGDRLALQRYQTDQDDLSGPIRAVLNLDDADRRAERLRSLLGLRIQAEAKRRSDADAIFIAALPSAARVLIPQIRFHDGLDLPVLAPAQAFPDTREDPEQDFEGLIFAEIPWFATNEPPAAEPTVAQGRLEALGIDAFHVSRLLHLLKQEPTLSYQGSSGQLRITEEGVIKRQLTPITVTTGELRRLRNSAGELLDFAP